MARPIGSWHKLSEEGVRDILRTTDTNREAAARWGVSEGYVSLIRRGKRRLSVDDPTQKDREWNKVVAYREPWWDRWEKLTGKKIPQTLRRKAYDSTPRQRS